MNADVGKFAGYIGGGVVREKLPSYLSVIHTAILTDLM